IQFQTTPLGTRLQDPKRGQRRVPEPPARRLKLANSELSGKRGALQVMPRSCRLRAHPHGPNEPSQPGHTSPPDTNSTSTSTGFAPTVSTAPPCATQPSRDVWPKRSPGGPSHALHRHGATPNEQLDPTGTLQDPSRTQCRIRAAPVSTLKDAGHRAEIEGHGGPLAGASATTPAPRTFT